MPDGSTTPHTVTSGARSASVFSRCRRRRAAGRRTGTRRWRRASPRWPGRSPDRRRAAPRARRVDAVLRFTRAPGSGPGEPAAEAAGAGGGGTPTTICSPSTRRRARLSPARSAPRRAPPAASRASTTRAPGSRTTMPGRRTLPVTSTTTSAAGLPEGATESPEAGAAGPGPETGARESTRPPSRSAHHAVVARASATTTASTARWPVPSATLPASSPPGDQPDRRAACRPGTGIAGGAGSGAGSGAGPGTAAGGRMCVCRSNGSSDGSSRRTAPSSALSCSSRRDTASAWAVPRGRMRRR